MDAQPAHPPPYAVRVLDVVERIPAGRVMTYGDVAEYLGGGAAIAVGNVMALHGLEVPWHRVVRATGEPNPRSPVEAIALLRAEGCPLLPDGRRVDLGLARWDGR